MLPEHGGDALALARRLGVPDRDILDFSSNADSLVEHLTGEILGATPNPFQRYPDPECLELRRALAGHEDIAPENLLVGNGSSELIFLALQSLAPRRALVVGPIFSEYVRACEALDIDCRLHVLAEDNGFDLTADDVRRLASVEADLAVVCAPNNPTGVMYGRLRELLGALNCPAVLVDATYREFLHGSDVYGQCGFASLRAAVRPGGELLVLASFTKYFYCPGVRLGYCLSSGPVIERLRRRRPPWMVSRFAELAGLRLLENLPRYRALQPEREALAREFREGLLDCGVFSSLAPSSLNFFFCKLSQGLSGPRVRQRLASEGLLVRACDNIPGAPPNYLRVQVKRREENRRLLQALSRRLWA